jgi:Family of unknown function (DUF5677)
MTLTSEEILIHAQSSHKATVIISKFVDDEIVPLLLSLIMATDVEQVINTLYYRLVLLARTMTLLDDPQHFQTVRTTERTAFEIFLDINQLVKDPSLIDKIIAFTKVTKFDSARKLIDAVGSHPEVDRRRIRHQQSLVDDKVRKKEFEDLIDKHWPPKKGGRKPPDHWSGKKISQRAKEAGIKL